ncbi:cytochrome P450 [Penicillium verhagenii]|uniref:cytochrome P450 n=1 Tax=Penicillium verhagenii TaxID=1562060 RepID=UPI002545299C|nr:cytochrome P450 [Penicillium verhagenii]KAJ5936910.1 cytochrome P450 [Penicillium verhagenii]
MPNLWYLFAHSAVGTLNRLTLDVHEKTIFALIRTYGGIFGVAYLLYWIGVVTYRLTLHPLAHIPGPFLCRISSLQQCYFEAILNGRFLERFPEYHRRYGPVVRISPNEVHLNDSSMYHEIYKNNSMFTKDATSYALGVSEAMAFTVSVEKHRQKRKTLDPNFSKGRVALMEDGFYEELELVFDRITEYEQRGEPLPGDIISRYLFGKSLDLVSSSNFVERAEQMRSFTKGIWIAIHFQFIRNTLLALPRWILAYLSDTFVKILWFTERLAEQAIQDFDMQEALAKSPIDETIFDRLLTDSARRQASGKDLRPLRFRELADESVGILNAGTEPTATMLSYATYFWLKFPHVQSRVLEELASVQQVKGRLPLQQLENLPYFTGFVKESLRYMPLVPGRLPRTVPPGEGLYVPSTKQTIPPGSVVGMSHLAIHFDPDVFEQPDEFRPERWIGEQGKALNRWLLSFSKGRTDCIGKT